MDSTDSTAPVEAPDRQGYVLAIYAAELEFPEEVSEDDAERDTLIAETHTAGSVILSASRNAISSRMLRPGYLIKYLGSWGELCGALIGRQSSRYQSDVYAGGSSAHHTFGPMSQYLYK